mmetsp:Transcript_42198/g.82877  ORF Transcript_42198/g.82877 Transcript_42198/m.82877 type:complete len:492 (-) Transcript_42198:208-1683(-)|eukprot:CAMPEP_0175088186 /NCGR_PEP_ID=MMETSP0086_2-20121207/117_1 /TAXON_ID=136419 /ORGANISM="Unknown Unknown, Strain D1" /LENGTH=491 /DNA_ID=CAMNT_0016360609 /DNA_START=72 /DNA_END=1547 /DNA_ORIENTATION=-
MQALPLPQQPCPPKVAQQRRPVQHLNNGKSTVTRSSPGPAAPVFSSPVMEALRSQRPPTSPAKLKKAASPSLRPLSCHQRQPPKSTHNVAVFTLLKFQMEMGCRNLDKRKVYIGVVLFYLAELIVFAVLVPMLSFVVVGVAPLVAGFLSHGAAVLLIYEFRVVSVCMNSEWVSSWVGARVAKRTQGFLDKAKGAMSTALLIGGSFLAYPLGPFLWALFLLLLAVLLFVFAPFLTYGVSEYPALQVALVGVTVSAVCLCACLSCPVWMLWWYTIFPCVYPVSSMFHLLHPPGPDPSQLLKHFEQWRTEWTAKFHSTTCKTRSMSQPKSSRYHRSSPNSPRYANGAVLGSPAFSSVSTDSVPLSKTTAAYVAAGGNKGSQELKTAHTRSSLSGARKVSISRSAGTSPVKHSAKLGGSEVFYQRSLGRLAPNSPNSPKSPGGFVFGPPASSRNKLAADGVKPPSSTPAAGAEGHDHRTSLSFLSEMNQKQKIVP